jgi:hypothetical protein
MHASTRIVGRTDRRFLISSLYLVTVANGLVAPVVSAVQNDGFWIAAFRTFDISLIVVAAAAVGFRLASRGPPQPVDALDHLATVILSIGLLVPLGSAPWFSLTLLAAYDGLRGRHSADRVAAAALFIGIAASQFWGRLIVETFSAPLLTADATLVTNLLYLAPLGKVERLGNIIAIEKGQPLAIMIGCSSLSNASYGLLCWMTLVRACRPAWQWTDAAPAVAVVLGIVALNVLRIALMGFSFESYLFFHGPVGAELFNAFVLLGAAAAAWRAVERGVPSSRLPAVPCAARSGNALAEGSLLRFPRKRG